MKKLLMSFIVVLTSSVALAEYEVSKITCLPEVGAAYFIKENIEIFLDRTEFPKITASFYKVANRYAEDVDQEISSGELTGTEYFEVVTLQGTVKKNEFQRSQSVKMKIHNGTLHFIDPLGRFVEPKPYDDREWTCTETAHPSIANDGSDLNCHGRPGWHKNCD